MLIKKRSQSIKQSVSSQPIVTKINPYLKQSPYKINKKLQLSCHKQSKYNPQTNYSTKNEYLRQYQLKYKYLSAHKQSKFPLQKKNIQIDKYYLEDQYCAADKYLCLIKNNSISSSNRSEFDKIISNQRFNSLNNRNSLSNKNSSKNKEFTLKNPFYKKNLLNQSNLKQLSVDKSFNQDNTIRHQYYTYYPKDYCTDYCQFQEGRFNYYQFNYNNQKDIHSSNKIDQLLNNVQFVRKQSSVDRNIKNMFSGSFGKNDGKKYYQLINGAIDMVKPIKLQKHQTQTVKTQIFIQGKPFYFHQVQKNINL